MQAVMQMLARKPENLQHGLIIEDPPRRLRDDLQEQHRLLLQYISVF